MDAFMASNADLYSDVFDSWQEDESPVIQPQSIQKRTVKRSTIMSSSLLSCWSSSLSSSSAALGLSQQLLATDAVSIPP